MDFDIKELDNFEKMLLEKATKTLPRETLQIMRKMGTKARTHVAKKSRGMVKKKTGNYHKAWKRGKAFKGAEGEYVIRVYNSSPHAHLIESGHRQVTKSGAEVGFVTGKGVLDKSMREFEGGEMVSMLDGWLEDLLESGKL